MANTGSIIFLMEGAALPTVERVVRATHIWTYFKCELVLHR